MMFSSRSVDLSSLSVIKEDILEGIRTSNSIISRCGQLLANSSLRLHEKDRAVVYQQIWTDEFVNSIMMYILGEKPFCRLLLVALGNTIAYPNRSFLDRILRLPLFTSFLLTALRLEYLELLNEQDSSIFELSIWIIANILQGLEGETPKVLEPVIPCFLQILLPNLHAVQVERSASLLAPFEAAVCGDPVQINPHFNGTDANVRRDQLFLRVFRCLSAIFSTRSLQLSYPNEYQYFRYLLERAPSFVQALLYEFRLGLEGKKILSINFYPEAYHRALTVCFLAHFPPGLQILVEQGVIELLGKALFTRFRDSELPTSLLWSRSIRALHSVAAHDQFHQLLRTPEIISAVLFAASFKETAPRVTIRDRKKAAEIVVLLRIRWEVERLFWLAQRKESRHSCPLHSIPSVLIKPIMTWLILFEDAEAYESQSTLQRHGYQR